MTVLDVVEIASQLVSIPSVNPMGQPVSGSEYGEHAVTDFLEQTFQRLGLPTERQRIEPGRENIVARLEGEVAPESGGSLLVFETHQDTVPVNGMTISPWDPTINGEKLCGRGACDVKGGMAAMLVALSRLAAERPAGMPTVVMACTVNEECGFTGARALSERWKRGESNLVPRLPDAMVAAEPTSLDVVVSHKGVVRWRCIASGRAAHSSCPNDGDNAIYRMASALNAIERFAGHLDESAEHALLGKPTISVGTIEGGVSVNTVPDRCCIEIDRRVLPDEDPIEARQKVIDWLDRQEPESTTLVHDAPFLTSEGLGSERNDELAQQLSRIARAHGCRGDLIGVPFATDAPAFARYGVPTLVFGPGSISQAHTADEWVSIPELRSATDVYYALAKSPIKIRPN